VIQIKAGKRKKLITALTMISIIITVVGLTFDFVIPRYLAYRFSLDATAGGSIGIIGGADGPTSIFIAGKTPSASIALVFALLSAAGIIYLALSRNTQK